MTATDTPLNATSMSHQDWLAAAEEEYRRLGDLLTKLTAED